MSQLPQSSEREHLSPPEHEPLTISVDDDAVWSEWLGTDSGADQFCADFNAESHELATLRDNDPALSDEQQIALLVVMRREWAKVRAAKVRELVDDAEAGEESLAYLLRL